MIYVRIKKINGRNDHYVLGAWLNQSGVGEVEYNEGGWNDRHLGNIAPHLKFEREEDAVAYVLANGGEISKTIPEMRPRWGVISDEDNEG
jgi:hypothetical protein